MTRLAATGHFTGLDLAWKISLAMLTVIALMAVASRYAIQSTVVANLYQENDAKANAIVQNLADNIVDPLLQDQQARMQLLLTNAVTEPSGGDIVYAFFCDREGRIVSHSFTGGFPTDLKAMAIPTAAEPFSHQVIATEIGTLHDIAAPVLGGDAGFIHVGQSTKLIEAKVEDLAKTITLASLMVAGVGLLLASLLARRITRPLADLAVGAERIGQGDLDYRVAILSRDEVGALARDFNRMAQALREDAERQKSTEEALRQSETIYRTLVEHIEFGVALVGQDCAIRMANAAYSRLFGNARETLLGLKCCQGVAGAGMVCDTCPGREAMASGTAQAAILELRRDNGGDASLKVNTFPILTDNGQSSGFIQVVEDVTEYLRLKMLEENSRKLESIGILAGGVAHDFNNLLNVILGNVSLTRLYLTGNPMAVQSLGDAEKACLQAAKLTKRLITFARGGAPRLQPQDIRELIPGVTASALSGSEVRCRYQFAEDLWLANIDSGQIEQVLRHVVVNAKEAMPAGGEIEVSAANLTIDAEAAPVAPGNYVRLTVTDHGSGIAPEHLGKVFDPYFSTKEKYSEKGSGLSLTICHSIIRQHKGLIEIHSTLGQGTTVEILLPAGPLPGH